MTASIGHQLMAARPRAMAALTRYFRDLDVAEDAFQNACEKAIRRWPTDPPDNATAWLIRVARNAGLDGLRRTARDAPLDEAVEQTAPDDTETAALERIEQHHYRDDILRLLFICCEPSLSASDQIILALKIVGGLSVDALARALLVQPRTMERRITRAKSKLNLADAAFETPSIIERGRRLDGVMTMLYLMFNESYTAVDDGSPERRSFADEAIRLCRLLLRLFPQQSEVMGLLALCLLQHSRRGARLDDAGGLVLLEDQDRTRWDRAMIDEGLILIEKALRRGQLGPYQIQAAIAGVHAQSNHAEQTDWQEIEALYAALEHFQPTPVIRLNRAVALAQAQGAKPALSMMEPLREQLAGFVYWHVLHGSLLADLGRKGEATMSYRRALELADREAERTQIKKKLVGLSDRARANRP